MGISLFERKEKKTYTLEPHSSVTTLHAPHHCCTFREIRVDEQAHTTIKLAFYQKMKLFSIQTQVYDPYNRLISVDDCLAGSSQSQTYHDSDEETDSFNDFESEHSDASSFQL